MLQHYGPANAFDPRLYAFSKELLIPNERPPSRVSVLSREVTEEERASLRRILIKWRVAEHKRRGGSCLLSAEVFLPPKQVDALCKEADKLASAGTVDAQWLHKVVPLDIVAPPQRVSLAAEIDSWANGLESQPPVIQRTPTSHRHIDKRTRAQDGSLPVPRNVSPSPSPRKLATTATSMLYPATHPSPSRIPRPSSGEHSNLDYLSSYTNYITDARMSYYKDLGPPAMLPTPRATPTQQTPNTSYYRPRTYHQPQLPSTPMVTSTSQVMASTQATQRASSPAAPAATPNPYAHTCDPRFFASSPSFVPHANFGTFTPPPSLPQPNFRFYHPPL